MCASSHPDLVGVMFNYIIIIWCLCLIGVDIVFFGEALPERFAICAKQVSIINQVPKQYFVYNNIITQD